MVSHGRNAEEIGVEIMNLEDDNHEEDHWCRESKKESRAFELLQAHVHKPESGKENLDSFISLSRPVHLNKESYNYYEI